MPPALALLFLLGATHAFKITSFHVPAYVPPEQATVELECSYEANFTILNWFKGPTEFFRYKPASVPSTRSFPILGVGTIDLISCGPTECRLRLGQLTEEASGTYRCDLELDKPPYKFETRTAYMKVFRHQTRKPMVEGLADEYGDNDEIKAYCRAEPNAEIRWYVNGKEMLEWRGNRALRLNSKLVNSQVTQPTVTVQCAEVVEGKLIGSNNAQAKWKKIKNLAYASENGNQTCSENKSNNVNVYSKFVCVIFAIISFSACMLFV